MAKKNKNENVASVPPEVVAELAEQIKQSLKNEGLIRERKTKKKLNVALRIKTDRGGEYLKSARKMEIVEFLAGNKSAPIKLGEARYKLSDTVYEISFMDSDGKEIVLLEKNIEEN